MRYPSRSWTAAFLIGLFIVIGCSRPQVQISENDGEEADVKPIVATVEVKREKLTRSITLPGAVEGMETSPLYAQMGGEIVEIKKDFGDKITGPVLQDGKVVKPGEVLAVVAIPDLQTLVALKQAVHEKALEDVKVAKSNLQVANSEKTKAEAMREQIAAEKEAKAAHVSAAQTTFNRAQQMHSNGSIRQEVFDETRFKLDAARADVKVVEAKVSGVEAGVTAATALIAKAQAEVDGALAHAKEAEMDLERQKTLVEEYTRIRAPFDGVVLKRTQGMDRGAFVQPAEGNSNAMPIFKVARTDVLRIFVHLPLSQVRWMRGDNKATLKLDSIPFETFGAHVARYSPSVDPETKTMMVELRLDKHDPRIYPGAYVTVQLQLVDYPNEPTEKAPLVVPASAVFTEEDGVFVSVIEGGIVKRRKVETFYEDGKVVGIKSGLTEGDEVVRAGGNLLREGQAVETPAKK